jgi:hypothetical protein
MKKLTSLACLLAILGLAVAANAQYPVGGELGMFFDGDLATTDALEFSTVQNFDPAFVARTVYAVALGIPEIAAYEFDVIPAPELSISGSAVFPPDSALDFAGDNLQFRAGTGGCVAAYSDMLPLLTYDQGYWPLGSVSFFVTAAATDMLVCLTGRTAEVPFYTICDAAGTKFIFVPATSGGADASGAPYPDGCAVINPTGEAPVGAEQSSFGSLKARY